MNLHLPPQGVAYYSVIREIGRGGLGTVDLIEITSSGCAGLERGTRWARKRLNANFDRHPTARDRFEREILATKSMCHRNIVSCRGESLPGNPHRFYLMPVYPRNLREYIANRGPTPLPNVARFGAVLAEAMSYAHERGFIHRDLKPENILLTADHSPIIADWGLGYFIHKYSKVMQPLTRGGMGTEYYCSLEQWSTGKCCEPGDIYSLGMVLAELTTGQPLQITAGMGIRQDVVSGGYAAARYNQLIRGMTMAFSAARLQSMAEVARELRDIVDLQ